MPITTYVVRAKFRGIKVKNRLAFLRKMTKAGRKELIAHQIKTERGIFNSNKFSNFPIGEEQICYCCVKNVAQLRHHVVPLANGGRNRGNNIVPLCKHCHSLIHPHLRGPKKIAKLKGAVASRHSVQPKN